MAEKDLLTFEEWLCDEPSNVPFDEMPNWLQVELKAHYDYDKTHRLSKQNAKTEARKDARFKGQLKAHGDICFEAGKKAERAEYQEKLGEIKQELEEANRYIKEREEDGRAMFREINELRKENEGLRN